MKNLKNIGALLTTPLLAVFLGLLAKPVTAYEVDYVRLTGTLAPVEQNGHKGVSNTIDVRVNGRVLAFQLTNVKSFKSGRDTRATLRRIFPAQLKFFGAENTIRALEDPEIVGKSLTITGLLYPVSRVFFVTEVDEAEIWG